MAVSVDITVDDVPEVIQSLKWSLQAFEDDQRPIGSEMGRESNLRAAAADSEGLQRDSQRIVDYRMLAHR